MRGKRDSQATIFMAAIQLDERIRPDHPLRAIKLMVDADLRAMDKRLQAAYADEGRPSIPPETLIKALLLQSLYSIRSEAQLVERIDHDLLFRWFLDLRIDQEVFDATVFCHNRKRLQEHNLVADFFNQTVRRAMAAGLVSTEHFSADGSLIEAYASIKSFKPKDQGASKESDKSDSNGFKSRNAQVDFHGQKRSNDTHASTTDPDAKLFTKDGGKGAKLRHGLHAIVENRHGLVLALEVNSPLGNSEAHTTLSLLEKIKRRFNIRPKTLGADKGYDQGPFLQALESCGVRPHVAVRQGKIGGHDPAYRQKHQANIAARTRMLRRTSGVGYQLSQRCRKKIEEFFGWAKTIAGLARSRHIGHWRTGQQAHLAAAAFNFIRLRNLAG